MEDKSLYELLLRSFDEELGPDEAKQLQKGLMESESLRAEKEKLISLRGKIRNLNLDFQPGFEARLKAKMESNGGKLVEHDFSRGLSFAFKRVVSVAAAVILILLGSIYLTSGSLNMDTITGADQLSFENLSQILLYNY